MIINHRAGEFVSGMMSRQFRTPFNIGVPLVSTLVGVGTGAWLWDGLAVIVPAAGGLFTYGVNLKARRHRVRPYELKRPTALTGEWVLELQDIYFRMPKEHRAPVEALLDGAYEQIERGNIDAVNPRLEKARGLQRAIVRLNEQLDTQEDIKAVESHVRAMQRAIEA